MRTEDGLSLTWTLINASKDNQIYVTPEQQYVNIGSLFINLETNEERREVADIWRRLREHLTMGNNTHFKELTKYVAKRTNKKIYSFRYALADWLIAQGKDVFDALNNVGAEVIIEYIEINGVTDEDLLFSRFSYVFQELKHLMK